MLTTSKCNITFFRLTLKTTRWCGGGNVIFANFSIFQKRCFRDVKMHAVFHLKGICCDHYAITCFHATLLVDLPSTCYMFNTSPPRKKHTHTNDSKGVANLLHVRPQQRGRKCKFAQIWNFTPFIYIFRIDNLRAISWFYRWWCLINSVWVLFG